MAPAPVPRALLPALRFLQGAAQLCDASAGLTFGAKPLALIGQGAQMAWGFRTNGRKAARKLSAVFGRIGYQPGRGLLGPGGWRQK
jgi:hypothetical protein